MLIVREKHNKYVTEEWISSAAAAINDRSGVIEFDSSVVIGDFDALRIDMDTIYNGIQQQFCNLVDKCYNKWIMWKRPKMLIKELLLQIYDNINMDKWISSKYGTAINATNYLSKLFKLSSRCHYQKSSTLIAYTEKHGDRLSNYRLRNHLHSLGHCKSQRLSNQFANAGPALYVREYVEPIFDIIKGDTAVLSSKGKNIRTYILILL